MFKKVLIIEGTYSTSSKVRRTLSPTTNYKLTLFSSSARSLQVTPGREVGHPKKIAS